MSAPAFLHHQSSLSIRAGLRLQPWSCQRTSVLPAEQEQREGHRIVVAAITSICGSWARKGGCIGTEALHLSLLFLWVMGPSAPQHNAAGGQMNVSSRSRTHGCHCRTGCCSLTAAPSHTSSPAFGLLEGTLFSLGINRKLSSLISNSVMNWVGNSSKSQSWAVQNSASV